MFRGGLNLFLVRFAFYELSNECCVLAFVNHGNYVFETMGYSFIYIFDLLFDIYDHFVYLDSFIFNQGWHVK